MAGVDGGAFSASGFVSPQPRGCVALVVPRVPLLDWGPAHLLSQEPALKDRSPECA